MKGKPCLSLGALELWILLMGIWHPAERYLASLGTLQHTVGTGEGTECEGHLLSLHHNILYFTCALLVEDRCE
jgi:hypothetical protein